MPKPNVWHWRPKFRPHFTRTFTDDVNGTPTEFTFTLWQMTDPEEMRALETAETLIARFIGSEDSEEEPVDFFPVGTEAIELTELGIKLACLIAYMQPPFVKADDRWSPEELIALRARASRQFRRDLNKFMAEVNGKKAKKRQLEELSENPPGADMSLCSDPHSAEISVIPN